MTPYMYSRIKQYMKGVYDDDPSKYRIHSYKTKDTVVVYVMHPPDRKSPPPSDWEGSAASWKKHCIRVGRQFRRDSQGLLLLAMAYDGEMNDGLSVHFKCGPDSDALERMIREARMEQEWDLDMQTADDNFGD